MRKLKRNSLIRKLLIPMLLVMLFQAALFTAAILWGGTLNKMNENSFDIFNERVSGRRNYLQSEMIQRWSNVEESVDAVTNKIQDNLAGKNISFGDLATNRDASNALIEEKYGYRRIRCVKPQCAFFF